MRLISLVYKNVARRPTRAALTVSGVALAVGAVVALVGISQGFENSLRAVYESKGVDLMVLRAGSVQQFSSSLSADLGDKVRRLPGVRKVIPAMMEAISLEDQNLFGVVLQGYPLDSDPVQDVEIAAGRRIRPGEGRVVMLGRVLARNMGKDVGQTVELVPGESFRVGAIYESYNVFENGSVIMALDSLQRMMARPGEVTHFLVQAEHNDEASLEELRRRIKALAPNVEVLAARQIIDKAIEIRLARSVAWLTSAIALVIGTVGMINTMLTAVHERTRELALLRAIGWRKARVLGMVLWESVLLGLVGAAAGTVLAIGLTQVLSWAPASGQLVSGDISAEVVAQGFVLALLVGVAGGIYPAYRAAQLPPTEGLRHE